MSIVKKILLVLTGLIAILIVVGLVLPQHYAVARELVIRAPATTVFELVGDLKRWPAWEPFSAEDPTTQTTLGATTTGVGASQSWTGEGNRGSLTFTQCDPARGIAYDLVFENGDQQSLAKSSMEFLPADPGSVRVRWGMEGEMNLPVFGGYFALFSDRMIGGMFERGLENLKRTAEGQVAAPKVAEPVAGAPVAGESAGAGDAQGK